MFRIEIRLICVLLPETRKLLGPHEIVGLNKLKPADQRRIRERYRTEFASEDSQSGDEEGDNFCGDDFDQNAVDESGRVLFNKFLAARIREKGQKDWNNRKNNFARAAHLRAANAVENHPVSITSGAMATALPGIGKSLGTFIQEVITLNLEKGTGKTKATAKEGKATAEEKTAAKATAKLKKETLPRQRKRAAGIENPPSDAAPSFSGRKRKRLKGKGEEETAPSTRRRESNEMGTAGETNRREKDVDDDIPSILLPLRDTSAATRRANRRRR